MEIRLNHDWMGHRKGSILNLVRIAAERLINIGTAVSVGQDQEQEGGETKDIESPPKDKMVKKPLRQKKA